MEDSQVAVDGVEKVDNNSLESQNETSISATEYPAKFKLVMIVVALVLSMFLVRDTLNQLIYKYEEHWQLALIGISGHGKLHAR
jgi:hypothetical protein